MSALQVCPAVVLIGWTTGRSGAGEPGGGLPAQANYRPALAWASSDQRRAKPPGCKAARAAQDSAWLPRSIRKSLGLNRLKRRRMYQVVQGQLLLLWPFLSMK